MNTKVSKITLQSLVKLELIKLKLTSYTRLLYIMKGLCNGNLLKDFHEAHHPRTSQNDLQNIHWG
jgi:hypothetical protein